MNIKTKIQEKGISSFDQRILKSGKYLNDNQTLSSYGFHEGYTLCLYLVPPVEFELHFLNVSFHLRGMKNDTIRSVKEKAQERTNIPIEQQQILVDEFKADDSKVHKFIADDSEVLKKFKQPLVFRVQVDPSFTTTVIVVLPGSIRQNFDVVLGDQVEMLKKQINARTGISIHKQTLYDRSIEGPLKDEVPLYQYYSRGVHTTPIIDLIIVLPIHIMMPSRNKIEILTDLDKKVVKLRRRLCQFDEHLQGASDTSLIFNEVIMDDHKILADYAVYDNAMFELTLADPFLTHFEMPAGLLRLPDIRAMSISDRNSSVWQSLLPAKQPRGPFGHTDRGSFHSLQDSASARFTEFTPLNPERFWSTDAAICPVVEPLVSELMNDVGAKARDQWMNFGTMLDIDSSVLYSFKARHNADPIACYRDVFTQWKVTTNHPYTWATVIEILESDVIGRHDLAAEIKRKHMRRNY